MFRRSSNQESLLEPQWLFAPEKRERLRASWAQVFRQEILSLIDEEPFRPYFAENNGQPNKSIRLLVGVHILKEQFDLTDEQVIENLEFHAMWQHALAVEPKAAHVCQKTLHNFRTLVVQKKLGDALFVATTKEIAQAAGISFARQRQDSTHVVSNMATLSRLGILVETTMVFLKELKREEKARFDALPAKYAERYLDREGYFSDAKKEQARRRLPVAAQDLFRLVQRFECDKAVAALPSFALMRRVFEEQCKVVTRPGDAIGVVSEDPCEPSEEATSDAASDQAPNSSPASSSTTTADARQGSAAAVATAALLAATAAGAPTEASGGAEVVLREPKEISSASLQSPHDPDATYGHKGKGYEVQLTETCGKENPFQLITSVGVNGAHESDQHALLPALDQLRKNGMAPDTMIADTGYGSGENIVEAAKCGTTLLAPVQDPNKGAKSDVRWENPIEPSIPGETPPAASAQVPQAPQPSESQVVEAAATKLSLADFQFSPDYGALKFCPAGHAPFEQSMNRDRVEAGFDASACSGCPLAGRCPGRQTKEGGRRLGYRPAEAATAHRQREQRTPAFKEAYRVRSGIESTNFQVKGPRGADDLRVRGKKRVALVLTLKALSVNVFRYVRRVVDELGEAGSCSADDALAEA